LEERAIGQAYIGSIRSLIPIQKKSQILFLHIFLQSFHLEKAMKWSFQKVPIRCLQGGSGSLLKVFCLSPNKETVCEVYESVGMTENDYKRDKLLIFEGGDYHGKNKD
jgi:hypothetical protein